MTTTLFAWNRLPDKATAEALRAEIAAQAENKLAKEQAGTVETTLGTTESGSNTESSSITEPSVTDENSAAEKALALRIAALGFDRSYVRGVLLDTPTVSPDALFLMT